MCPVLNPALVAMNHSAIESPVASEENDGYIVRRMVELELPGKGNAEGLKRGLWMR